MRKKPLTIEDHINLAKRLYSITSDLEVVIGIVRTAHGKFGKITKVIERAFRDLGIMRCSLYDDYCKLPDAPPEAQIIGFDHIYYGPF